MFFHLTFFVWNNPYSVRKRVTLYLKYILRHHEAHYIYIDIDIMCYCISQCVCLANAFDIGLIAILKFQTCSL